MGCIYSSDPDAKAIVASKLTAGWIAPNFLEPGADHQAGDNPAAYLQLQRI